MGSLMGVGSLLKFWGPERPPPSKIEKPLKSHGLSIGISHQIDPTPKGREGAKDSLIVLGSLVPEGSEDPGERREDRRPKRGLESSTEGGRTWGRLCGCVRLLSMGGLQGIPFKK